MRSNCEGHLHESAGQSSGKTGLFESPSTGERHTRFFVKNNMRQVTVVVVVAAAACFDGIFTGVDFFCAATTRLPHV